MPVLPRLASLWRNLFKKDQTEQEISQEVQAYLEMLIEAKIGEGLGPDEARRAALIEMGGVEQVKESVREVRMGQTLEAIWQDLRYGVRMLVRFPGFTCVAVLTLALGIGANTAIFSMVSAVLLQPLPYKDADRLVIIQSKNTRQGYLQAASYLQIRDWSEQNQVFEDVAQFADYRSVNLGGGDRAERVRANVVSPTYFELLGTPPQLGRVFSDDDNRVPGGHPIVLLSHGLWQRRFGGDPQIVGQALILNDRPFTIVGVLPASFRDLADEAGFRDISEPTDIWLPLMMASTVFNPNNLTYLEVRQARLFIALARLKEGSTLEEAQAELDAIGGRLARQYPNTDEGISPAALSLYEYTFGDVRLPLLMLMLAAGFVLMIGCANIANLLLARAAARKKEMAVRAALGASRDRLVRQLLTESLLLAVLGGALGLLLAFWGTELLLAISPGNIPRLRTIKLDSVALVFTFGISLSTGLLFGLAPALHASRPQLDEGLKEGGRIVSGSSRHRLRRLLVVSEAAAATVLLIGAGLMIKSFQRLNSTSIGFRTEHLLTARFDLRSERYAEQQARLGFSRRLIEEIAALPDVEAVALWGPQLPGRTNFSFDIVPEGRLGDRSEDLVRVNRHHVTADALRNLEIPILRGRGITEQDSSQSAPVAVLSETAAREAWPGEDPIGKRFRADPSEPWTTVVGVAADANHRGRLNDDSRFSDIYYSYSQRPLQDVALLIRAHSEPDIIIDAVRQKVQALDPNIALYDVATMRERLRREEEQSRFAASLMGLYSLLALSLAVVGLYGTLAYVVVQRTHEIGVRMALGAKRRTIFQMIVGQGMLLMLIGIAIGLTAALALTRFLSSLLFGVSATDLMTFLGIAALLSGVALLASYIPARRATKVDPVVALRCE